MRRVRVGLGGFGVDFLDLMSSYEFCFSLILHTLRRVGWSETGGTVGGQMDAQEEGKANSGDVRFGPLFCCSIVL